MIHRHLYRATIVYIFAYMFLFSNSLFAQVREYSFNTQGSSCFFNYLCFAPNNDYLSIKRPFILVVGKKGESIQDVYKNDTIKNQASFYNYLMVYIPNNELTIKKRLECIAPLTSLLTETFKYGINNLFLVVKDPEITNSDISKFGINTLFRTIRLSELTEDSTATQSVASLSDDFKETFILEEAPKEEPESGTFYYENTNSQSGEMPIEEVKKTYFGPPTAKNFTLTGVVVDKSTGEALPFATIIVKGTTSGVTTNADGFFTISKVPTDTSVIITQYLGYEKTEQYLTPQTPKRNLKINLKQSTQSLQTVNIYGQKEDVVLSNKTDVSLIKVTPKEIAKLPSMGEKDVMRSFQLMPGISASNESSSGLYVRGGTPDQNLVLYDGFTVYQVDHLYGFYSAFNSNAVKDVQLYKGGFESKFGGRLSSVTEITAKDGNQKKFNLGVDLSLLSLNAFVEIPIGSKFSSVIAYRRSYKGLLYNAIFKKFNTSTSASTEPVSDGPGGKKMSQSATVTSYFYDLNGKFTFRPTAVDVISLSLYNGTDMLDNSTSTEASSFGATNSGMSMSSTDLTEYGNIGGSLKWARKWNDKLFGNTIFSYSNYFSDRNKSQTRTSTDSNGDSTTNSNGIFENNDLKDFSVKSDYQWDLFHFCQLQFGGFATKYDINYTYAQNDTSTVLDRTSNAMLVGGYIQSKIKIFSDKIQFVPGIRTSYFETTKKLYYEPRAAINISLSKKITLKGAYGNYYQFANRVTREDIISGSKDFWLLSDGTSVPVSSSIHYVAGLSYENNNYLMSAEAYYKKISNLTEYSLRINPNPMGVSYNENFFNGYGYSQGIELLLQKKSGKLNGWLSYTLGEAKNHFEVYSDVYYPANQDVTHEFKAVAMYQYKRWDFAATWVYATGRPYTAPSGAYSITLLDGSTQDFFTVTAKNGLRLPDYHRCDLSANYKLLVGSKGDKKRREIGYIGLSIFNIYNRENVWYKQFTIVDGSILETNIKYLGITPNLTLSLKIR